MSGIIAHRGFWTANGTADPSAQNGLSAFRAAIDAGFGIETDVRDYAGDPVISHDPAGPDALPFEDFLSEFARAFDTRMPLAINVKADGLAETIADALARHGVASAFVFDMSIPDTLAYTRLELPVFLRHSEFERYPDLEEQAVGIWMDELTVPWITGEAIANHLAAGRSVCAVSPELHGRVADIAWQVYSGFGAFDRFMVCTDYPDRLRERLSEAEEVEEVSL